MLFQIRSFVLEIGLNRWFIPCTLYLSVPRLGEIWLGAGMVHVDPFSPTTSRQVVKS